MTSASLTAATVTVPTVVCAKLTQQLGIYGIGRTSKGFKLDLRLSTQDRFKTRIGMWNVGTLTGRSRECNFLFFLIN